MTGASAERAARLAAVDPRRLLAWLQDNTEGVSGDFIEIDLLAGGHSNLTYSVQTEGRSLVLRRPPLDQFAPTANDMGREYRFYQALHGNGVPVPRVLARCDSDAVLGAPFYVMERVDGVVPQEPDSLTHITEGQAAALSAEFVTVLGRIHDVDYAAIGLAEAGNPQGYVQRQLSRWTDLWRQTCDTSASAVDELGRRLTANIPPASDATVVHGDYRLGNVMVDAADPTRIVAVFDWEMATLGDPLADLGFAFLYWGTKKTPYIGPTQKIADGPGFASPDDLVALYAEATGRSTERLNFYIGLAAYKLTIISYRQRARTQRAGGERRSVIGTTLAEWSIERLRAHV